MAEKRGFNRGKGRGKPLGCQLGEEGDSGVAIRKSNVVLSGGWTFTTR